MLYYYTSSSKAATNVEAFQSGDDDTSSQIDDQQVGRLLQAYLFSLFHSYSGSASSYSADQRAFPHEFEMKWKLNPWSYLQL